MVIACIQTYYTSEGTNKEMNIFYTCNQATSEGTNISAATRCKINMPCRWWNISNCVSLKHFEESRLLELLSSKGNLWSDLPSNLDVNCWDPSLPLFLESNNSFLCAWLRKEAVKKLLQKHEATLRITIVKGNDPHEDFNIIFQHTPVLIKEWSKPYARKNYNIFISNDKMQP